jgi:hypothetical protein
MTVTSIISNGGNFKHDFREKMTSEKTQAMMG